MTAPLRSSTGVLKGTKTVLDQRDGENNYCMWALIEKSIGGKITKIPVKEQWKGSQYSKKGVLQNSWNT